MACSGSSSEGDDDGGITEVSSGGRKPGGGPTSGGEFNSSGEEPSGSSSGGSSSGSSSGSSASSGSSSSSSSSGEPCDDPNDAPDDDAEFITPIDVGGASIMVQGVLSSALDADWYAYDVNGNNPSFSIFIPSERPETSLCAYFTCDDGVPNVTCDLGDEETDGHNAPGCCSIGTATAQASVSGAVFCTGSVTDTVKAYVVLSSQAIQCAPYTLRVGF